VSNAEVERLRAYLKAGGFLLADSCCGRDAFAFSFEREMKKVFPEAELKVLAPEHPVFSVSHEIKSTAFTPGRSPGSRSCPGRSFTGSRSTGASG